MEADDNVIPFPGAFRGTAPEADHQGPEAIRSWLARVMDGGLDPAGVLAAVQGAVAPDFLAGGGWGLGGMNLKRPTLLKQGRERACFVVRLDLDDAHPPIWRRLRLASDLTLSQLHDVVQIAMGWTDSHLHHFQMGPDEKNFRMAPFLTSFDLDEGETEGILESEVRLDQVIARPGQRLFYEYDFGDGWEHTLKLEKVEDWVEGDPVAVCITGRRACPPEDVGGIPGYEEVLAALDGEVGPHEAEWMAERLEWLPDGFDPAAFDLAEVNELLNEGPPPSLESWHPEVGNLLARSAARGPSGFAGLVKQAIADWVEPDDAQVIEAVQRYRVFLRTVGPGITLTAAGYLPPRIVDALYQELEMDSEWVGKGNREDMTLPVLTLRESATALGLVRKAKGKLTVTKLGQKVADDPHGLLAHLRARVPLGRPHERDAGLLGLLFAAAGRGWWEEADDAAELYASLGWHDSRGDLGSVLRHAAGGSLDVLDHLVGRRADAESRAVMARLLLRRS